VAKLAGGVAVVKVGAATETEMKEKKARVEDALHAVIFYAGNNARFITSDGGATWTPAKD